MPVKIALDSFLAVATRSRLLKPEQAESLRAAYAEDGGDPDDARRFAEFLVRRDRLTAWQAEKLLQGKHKGFFLGKYKLLSLLGKGGMSSVYLAEHVLMRRRCAIKVLPTKRVRDTSYLGRFHREAQAVASLDHPNIVRAYDVDQEVDGDMEIHFLVMEYVEGKSLLELVQDQGALPTLDAANFIRQAALGLAHAHQAGLVHRDIKPGNLLVDKNGVVKLLDLGLARFFAGSEDVALTIQHDEKVLGTADYLAPEQAVDSHLVDARADIYSLGCTFYFLLTGHAPFTDGTLTQRLLAHQTREPPPVEKERSDVPASLSSILRKMMAKDPAHRYQSSGEVAAHLGGWLLENGGAHLVQGSDVHAGTDAAAGGAPAEPPAQNESAEPATAPADGSSVEPELSAFLKQLNDSDPRTDARIRAAVRAEKESQRRGPQRSGAGDSSKTRRRRPSSGRGRRGESRRPNSAIEAEPAVEAVPVREPGTDDGDSGAARLRRKRDAETSPAGDSGSAAVETVAVDEPSSQVGVYSRRRTSRQPNKWIAVAAGAVGVVVVTLIAVIFSGDEESPAPPEEDVVAEITPGGPEAAAGSAVPDDLGPELRVGEDGEFSTIAAAVDYVREHASRFAGETPWVIRVSGGQTLDEGIVIEQTGFNDVPEGTRIVSDSGSPAVLRSDGESPVIDLTFVEGLTIDGFVVDAGGAEVAVRLSDFMVGTRLQNLEIVNFSRIGIDSSGAQGLRRQPLRFRNLTVHPDASRAVAVKLQDPRQIELRDCRFRGPMQAGVEILSAGRSSDVTIRGCIFHALETGVLFSGEAQDLQSVAFINNTFHEVETGVRFARMPQPGSRGLAFKHNLFTGMQGPETRIVEGFDSQQAGELLLAGDAVNNWSERPADSSGDAELDIFATGGRRGIEPLAFDSRNPDSAAFLKPSDAALRTEVTAPADAAAPYVGAVAP